MSDFANHRVFVPTINPDNHGAKIVVCGALMLPPVATMVSLGVYNRFRAKTLLQADGMIMLLGTVRYDSTTIVQFPQADTFESRL